MAQKHLDLIYFAPLAFDKLDSNDQYDHVVYFDRDCQIPDIKAFKSEIWAIDLPKDTSYKTLQELRDSIEDRVKELVSSLSI